MNVNFDLLIANLKKNNMDAFYAENKEEALIIVKKFLPDGATVTHGGSKTLAACGVPSLLKSGNYRYLDRDAPGLTREQIEEIYRQAFFADVYLSSTNAITLDGTLYNVDGNSNRVAALLYGPKSVVILAGVNKIVPDLNAAAARVKQTAAPLNAQRLNCATYCREKGRCVSAELDAAHMSDGCGSQARICCNYVISGKQRVPGRMKIILINEDLGF